MREAVELLTGESQALIVSEHGRPVGIVTRTDLLESLVTHDALRDHARSTPASSPIPTYGGVVPAIHQSTTYVQPAPGEFVEDYDYSRSANPTRAALERALGELEGGLGSAFSSGMAAEHALITAVC